MPNYQQPDADLPDLADPLIVPPEWGRYADVQFGPPTFFLPAGAGFPAAADLPDEPRRNGLGAAIVCAGLTVVAVFIICALVSVLR